MHRSLIKTAAHATILTASILGTAVAGLAAGFVETDLVANKSPLTDSNGVVHNAPNQDPNLLNPWGLTASSSSPFWVSDNGAGVSTLYNTAGTPQALVVSIPAPGDPLGKKGTPTGAVFNIDPALSDFQISGVTATGIATKARSLSEYSQIAEPRGIEFSSVFTSIPAMESSTLDGGFLGIEFSSESMIANTRTGS